MLQEEIIEFFNQLMPFNLLSRDELQDLVKNIAMEYYPKGSSILVQDGPPSEHFYVIKKGIE